MKKTRLKTPAIKGFEHDCDWRKATVKLAQCVVATLRTDGKIGVGSGLVTKVVDGKRIVERWDKDFIEALAFIGIEVSDKRPTDKKSKPTKVVPGKGARAA